MKVKSLSLNVSPALVTQLNGKLYAVAKVQFDKQCPAVANASPSEVVR